MAFYPPPGTGSIEIKDEGVTIAASATSLDFTGTGVTATAVGSDVTANIPGGGGGGGTVETVAVASANGFAGTSDGDPADPVLTLSTTVTGILSGNGTAISAASTTGSGAVVLANTPTLITPVLGVATATSINGLTLTSSTGTLTLTNAKTLAVTNTLTFGGTDGSTVAFGTGGTVLYATSTLPLTVGNTTIASGTDTRVLFDNAGVLGEYAISGTGSVAMTTSPVFTTPNIGNATGNISGNAATVTTNANLTGDVTSVGNATTLVGGTSPSFTTSIVTASTTFSLVNATATTVNFAGAATTLNIGGSATVLNFGGGATAAEFRFLEPSGSGTNYTAFKAVAQGANITYSLPPTVGAAGTVLTDVAGDGVLTWAAGGGLSWGASISGTTPDGLTLTVSNSASAGVTGLNVTIGNTQSNAVGGIEVATGTQTSGYGISVVGTFGAATDGTNAAVVLHGNTASNNSKVISGGNGTGFTESFSIRANGAATFSANTNTTAFTISPSAITNNTMLLLQGTAGMTTGAILRSITNMTDYRGKAVEFNFGVTSAPLTARTSQFLDFAHQRTNTATTGTVADSFNFASFVRTSVQNGAGGTLTAAGSVGYFENVATQTAGTLTDSVNVLQVTQDADSTGFPIRITQNAIVTTNFRKIITESNAGVTLWVSNGTDPNGTLSGTAGDVCFNCNGSVIKYCTGTTNWA